MKFDYVTTNLPWGRGLVKTTENLETLCYSLAPVSLIISTPATLQRLDTVSFIDYNLRRFFGLNTNMFGYITGKGVKVQHFVPWGRLDLLDYYALFEQTPRIKKYPLYSSNISNIISYNLEDINTSYYTLYTDKIYTKDELYEVHKLIEQTRPGMMHQNYILKYLDIDKFVSYKEKIYIERKSRIKYWTER